MSDAKFTQNSICKSNLKILPEFVSNFEVGVSACILSGHPYRIALGGEGAVFAQDLGKIDIAAFPVVINQNNMGQVFMDI